MQKGQEILVTGGSGYLASWIIKYLLEAGHYVRTTVRDKNKTEKLKHLLKIAETSTGKLELFEADLLKPGSFDEAMRDCTVLIHTASPFQTQVKDPQKELVEPALEGTRNVLATASKTPSVKKVVLTSSVVAIYGDASDIDRTVNKIFNEEHWNHTSNLNYQPYPYSKTVAEKEAWRLAEAQSQWKLVTLNPGFILGPSLTDRVDSFSIDFMLSMANGKYKSGVPELYFCVVDVRDVARAHIKAAMNPETKGRHILVADTVKMLDIAKILHKKFGNKYAFPKMQLPKTLLYLVGPVLAGLSWRYINNNVGIYYKLDNTYSIKDLGMEYRPLETTFTEHLEQLISSNLL